MPIPRGFRVNLLKVESDGRTTCVIRVITFRQEELTIRVPNGNVQPRHGRRSDQVVRTLLNVPRWDEKRCIQRAQCREQFILVQTMNRTGTGIDTDVARGNCGNANARDDNKDRDRRNGQPPFCFWWRCTSNDRRSLPLLRSMSINVNSNCQFFVIAFIKALNSGCGRCGRLLNSGWN